MLGGWREGDRQCFLARLHLSRSIPSPIPTRDAKTAGTEVAVGRYPIPMTDYRTGGLFYRNCYECNKMFKLRTSYILRSVKFCSQKCYRENKKKSPLRFSKWAMVFSEKREG